jgi:hypothetical protein
MKIIIEADFSPWEIAWVIQAARKLDRTGRTIFIGLDAPEFSQGQAKAVLDFLDPPMENIRFFPNEHQEV